MRDEMRFDGARQRAVTELKRNRFGCNTQQHETYVTRVVARVLPLTLNFETNRMQNILCYGDCDAKNCRNGRARVSVC